MTLNAVSPQNRFHIFVECDSCAIRNNTAAKSQHKKNKNVTPACPVDKLPRPHLTLLPFRGDKTADTTCTRIRNGVSTQYCVKRQSQILPVWPVQHFAKIDNSVVDSAPVDHRLLRPNHNSFRRYSGTNSF